MLFPISIETSRMMFRLLNETDIAVIHRQFSDPDMCRYFSEPPCTLEEAWDIIRHYQSVENDGYLRYAMFDKVTDAFVGTCGYHYWDIHLKQVEIGYDVWKEYWRQGYISEALPVLINQCFEHLGVECVYVLIHPQNIASISSVRKFGFQECEPCRKPDTEQEICRRLLRKDWSEHRIFRKG